MTWDQAFLRLSGVRDELEATRFALDYVQRRLAAGEDPIPAISPIRPAHLRLSLRNIETTYLLRTFAEFEAILRDYWSSVRPGGKPKRTRMEVLMNRIAILCLIPFDALDEAHEVREFRNCAVHNSGNEIRLSFQDCKSRLGLFLSYLPTQW